MVDPCRCLSPDQQQNAPNNDMQIKLVILDFDGVIVESNDIKDKVFQQIFSRYPDHYETLLNYHRTYISVSRYAKFEFLLKTIGQKDNEELKNQLLQDFSSITLEMMKTVSFVKGAKAFLAEIQDQLPVYLASVTPIYDLEIILDSLRLKQYFKGVYGSPPWKKPDAIKDILQKENISAQNTVLVGDSYGDQRAANENKIHFIGRNSGLGFEDPQPDLIISDLTGLFSLVQKIDFR